MSEQIIQIGGGGRAALVRRGRSLEYLTIGWNSLEGLIAVGAGLAAGSIALVGFGFDSVIEVTSGVALLWRPAPERARRLVVGRPRSGARDGAYHSERRCGGPTRRDLL